MQAFRKPDLHAPRYRSTRKNILNEAFYNSFREAHPHFAYLTNKDIKSIVTEVNGKIWQRVIDKRDGVELPERLGYIFIGSCPPKRSPNRDYFMSKKLETEIRHRNWESDNFLAKIFYTNYGNKYRFQFAKLWGLSPTRDFSRTVGKTYPSQYNLYVQVEDKKTINELFRKRNYKMIVTRQEQDILKTYDEFDLD